MFDKIPYKFLMKILSKVSFNGFKITNVLIS